ncbi:NUDIX domain-containing protein [Candidatus Paraluminiphilus aquimaris]|uniref:NUDIX domain-containing protein n=1 Tax=Candidatus Paraluminiphilus aquimaris TaxID=2518994 RepID=A0ABY6Q5U6_9GAMM|nr:polysaccharide biosynthesis protein [Candidatus Paraluminiphilus aquimaris]UZP74303.1 NUDIX domain-containing protein [Candidatus Paraluminiphilus aquimaris]
MFKSNENNSESEIHIDWIQAICSIPRGLKKIIQIIFDFSVLLPLYVFVSWLLYEDVNIKNEILFGLIFVVISLTALYWLKIYGVVVRFSGFKMMQLIVIAQLISVVILGLISVLVDRQIIPASFILLFFTSVFFIGGGRLMARKILDFSDTNGKRVLIYGVGKVAVQLMTSIRREPGYDVLGFIDDGINLTGLELHGLPVFANVDLEDKIIANQVSIVVLANREQAIFKNSNLLDRLEILPVEVKCAPLINAYLKENDNGVNYLEELRVEDIVGRESVQPDQDLMRNNITRKVVLITGAGGSIGSELCRQVINLSPQKLILLEASEYALFSIHQELADYSDRVLPVLGSVCDIDLVENLLNNEKIDTVYHAAAYKHVPLVEANPFVGVYNNVFGTKIILDASIRAGVSSFTLISTDKAVRPTNIMGASKRIAEILCQIASARGAATTIASVRFGNVIGSSGSVIPKFREQIRNGGPVTVTHPEITRFFMGIPEASELVIQASSMAKGGDVFVLDMGDQVKILDLVKKLIRFSGKVVETEQNKHLNPIKIIYTGLRPGEKLYEELLISGEFKKTSHPKIMQLKEPCPDDRNHEQFLENLNDVLKVRDISALKLLLSKNNLGYVSQNDSQIVQTKNEKSFQALGSKDLLEATEKKSVAGDTGLEDSRAECESALQSKSFPPKSVLGLKQKYLINVLHKYFLLSRGLTMGVRCAVFNDKEEVLLVKHTYIEGWHLPGGGIDIDESAEEAVFREVREETSIMLREKPKLLGVYHSKHVSKRDHVVLFIADKYSKDESVDSSFEISASKFIPINSLPDDLEASSRYWLTEALSRRGNKTDKALIC